MVKHNSNHESNNNNQSGKEARLSIDNLLAAKRASNEHGRSKASQTITGATKAVRANAGKATRAQLQNELVQSAQLAQLEGEEDGIKQFLTEDIPSVVNALQGRLKDSHSTAIASSEQRLIEGAEVETDWGNLEVDFDTSFEPGLLSLDGTASNQATLRAGDAAALPSSNHASTDNPFTSKDLPT
ncbi:MAG: hypothetical protein AAFQ80_15140 [Cyanobacteria bacterium J06621_8]